LAAFSGVDRGASLPRRHILSAAGALAATLLLAVPAPAGAQDAGGETLRGSIGLPEGFDDLRPPPAPTLEPIQPITSVERPEQEEVTPVQPLGGLGDVAPPTPAVPPLGGLGDVSTELEEGEEVVVPPEPEFGLAPPTRVFPEPAQIHTALLPEPHDLDPFVPIGFRLGSFLLFPEAEIGADMSNNVLATRFDPQSDIGPEVTPKVRLTSDWSRHSLTFEGNADRIWYSEFPIADVKNYQLLLRGRLDVTSRTHLSGEIEKSQIQEGPSSISITDIAGNNEVQIEQHATAGIEHTFNRLTLKLNGTIADYNYSETTDTTLAGPVPFMDIRDYRETLGTLRSTYEFQSNWAGFIETSVNERDYREPINIAGIRRGSSGFTIQGGVNLRLAGTLFGEIAAGWGEQQPIDDRLSTISGPLINGDLIWMPTVSTKLEFLARSEIDETTLEDSAGAIDHFFELSLQQAFWRYLVLGVYASYEQADFSDDPEIDRRTKLGATAEYYFNPVLSAYARYEHTDFTSTPDSSSDFVEDEVKIGLKLRR
jgi:hypothetical protein